MYRTIRLTVLMFLVLLWAACTPTPAPELEATLPDSMKGYELYSWQEADGSWRHTLVTGTNRQKTAVELMEEDNAVGEDGWVKITVSGTEELINLVERLPAGESVFWMGAAATDGGLFRLPDSDVVAAVAQQAGELGLQLTVAKTSDPVGMRQVEVESGPTGVSATPLPAGLSLTAPGWIHTI